MNEKGVFVISRLARVRKVKGFSQQRLSMASGVSRVTISRIEAGKISPTVRTLEKLSFALKVPVADIVEKAG